MPNLLTWHCTSQKSMKMKSKKWDSFYSLGWGFSYGRIYALPLVPVIQQHNLVLLQCSGVKNKLLVLFKKWCCSTTMHFTFGFPFWALTKTAEPSKIAISSRFNDEDINLMVRYADICLAKKIVEGLTSCFSQLIQTFEIANPYSPAILGEMKINPTYKNILK